jgi:hypothetical protein
VKFMDSPYYSKSEFCRGVVTVFFEVPPLASDALLTSAPPTSRKRDADR